jgi:hypothetical protein
VAINGGNRKQWRNDVENVGYGERNINGEAASRQRKRESESQQWRLALMAGMAWQSA